MHKSQNSPAVFERWHAGLFRTVLAVVLLYRFLFMVTFPLNDRGGDSGNYLEMVRKGTSSLVHAGGYPFFVGLPFRHGPWREYFERTTDALPFAILVGQHVTELLVLYFLYRVTSKIFGPLTGALTLLIAGTSLQALGVTSSTYPEWLQAACVVMFLGVTYYAWAHERVALKMALYALAAAFFTLAVLTKFNAAVLGAPLALAILSDKVSATRKLAAAGVCILSAAILAGAYILLHHQPQTGTYALTYDRSWVLLTRVQYAFDNRLEPDAGLDTRRWLALSGVLPASYEVAGPGLFERVDAVPAEIRDPYRDRWAYLATAGPDEVERVRAAFPLPEEYSVGLSAIPVAYYIGLRESDELGVRVAIEAVRYRPRQFTTVVWRDLEAVVRHWPYDSPYPGSPAALSQFGVVPEGTSSFGFSRVSQRPDYFDVPFSYSRPVLWLPGVQLLSLLRKFELVGSAPALFTAAAVLVGLLRLSLLRCLEARSIIAILVAGLVAILVVASTVTLSFRWKEARLAMPLVSVLAAWVLSEAIGVAERLTGRKRPPSLAA